MGNTVYHLEYQSLLKILVVIATAVVVVYLSAIGYLDFTSSSDRTALSPSEAGDTLVANGNYAEAITLYQEQVVELDEAVVEANLGLAQSYQGASQLADAEAIYRRVIRLDASQKAAYIGLARVLIDQGKYAQARTELKAGLVAFPNDVDLLKLDDEAEAAQQG